jgi:hypothetical protein
MAAGLSHPNIVPIHRVSEAGGFVFFVMSYVDAGFVREGPAGTFYLHEARASTIMRGLIVKTVVFWFLVIIVPVIILQISNSRPAP